MARNIEIKARLGDPKKAYEIAQKISGGPPEVLHQVDRFFTAPAGKLKLRTFGREEDAAAAGELIWYNREAGREPRPSDYIIAPTTDPAAMRAILEGTLPSGGVVRKRRLVFLVGRTRIHLDEVEGLGSFLELEVVMREGDDEGAARSEAMRLLRQFGIDPADLLALSYVDMLESGRLDG